MPDQSPGSSRQRAVRRRQAVAVAVLFSAALVAIFAALWPELPFPQLGGLLAVLACGLLFGLMLPRWWAPLLALCVLPAGVLATGNLWAAVVALFVAGPAAGVGLLGGAAWSLRRIVAARAQARAASESEPQPRRRARGRRRRSRAPLVEAPQGP